MSLSHTTYDRSRTNRARHCPPNSGPLTLAKLGSFDDLWAVREHLKRCAGQAPGPDGRTFDDLNVGDVMQASWDVLSGFYCPSAARHVHIPKANGNGTRRLSIRNCLSRIAEGWTNRCLAELVDPAFQTLEVSHAFRPKRSRITLIRRLERQIRSSGCFWVCTDDIEAAFDNCRIDDCLAAYGHYFIEEAVLAHIERILRGTPPRAVGLEQGSAPSCTSLNVLLHANLDFPLTWTHPGIVHGRYADDTVVAAQSEDASRSVRDAAGHLLSPLQLSLKGAQPDPVDIRRNTIEYLGFRLRWVNGGFRFYLAESTWQSLNRSLAVPQAHEYEPINTVAGWLSAHSPALWHENQRRQTVNRLRDTLHGHGMHVDHSVLFSTYDKAITSWRSFIAKDNEEHSLTQRTDVSEERICDRDSWMYGRHAHDVASHALSAYESSSRSRG